MFKINLLQRIAIDLLLIVGAYLLPWWIILIAVIFVLFLFAIPEVVLIGVLLDALHAVPIPFYFEFEFIFTTLFIVLILAVTLVKRKLITYS